MSISPVDPTNAAASRENETPCVGPLLRRTGGERTKKRHVLLGGLVVVAALLIVAAMAVVSGSLVLVSSSAVCLSNTRSYCIISSSFVFVYFVMFSYRRDHRRYRYRRLKTSTPRRSPDGRRVHPGQHPVLLEVEHVYHRGVPVVRDASHEEPHRSLVLRPRFTQEPNSVPSARRELAKNRGSGEGPLTRVYTDRRLCRVTTQRRRTSPAKLKTLHTPDAAESTQGREQQQALNTLGTESDRIQVEGACSTRRHADRDKPNRLAPSRLKSRSPPTPSGAEAPRVCVPPTSRSSRSTRPIPRRDRY